MNPIEEFEKIRDIPYRIPLSTAEKDECCTGKTMMLLDMFKKNGLEARYRICTFKWSSINLPQEVKGVPHDDNSSHMFAEVKIDGRWVVVDPTWDKGVEKVLPINHWDGKSNTKIAVPIDEILPPEEGVKYMAHVSTPEAVEKDFDLNRDFYRAFNKWLEQERK